MKTTQQSWDVYATLRDQLRGRISGLYDLQARFYYVTASGFDWSLLSGFSEKYIIRRCSLPPEIAKQKLADGLEEVCKAHNGGKGIHNPFIVVTIISNPPTKAKSGCSVSDEIAELTEKYGKKLYVDYVSRDWFDF